MIPTRLHRFFISALLATAIIAVYGPVTGYDFVNIDDSIYVTENANVNGGLSWASFKWAFENPVAGNWHPMTVLSHMVDCQIYGLYAGGHHLTNVLLHIANTLLLFWVLLAMTNRIGTPNSNLQTSKKLQPPNSKREPRGSDGGSPRSEARKLFGIGDWGLGASNLWPCALVAALFALHPLHVESVAWVSERKDVLSGFFFMLTLWAYVRFAQKTGDGKQETGGGSPKSDVQGSRFKVQSSTVSSIPSSILYLLSLAFFALGLMSKPMLVTLPFVLLLLDFWPLGRFELKTQNSKLKTLPPLLLEKLPFFALAAIFSAITLSAQKSAGAVVALENFPLEARLANAVVSYTRYLGKAFWPDSLAVLYPYAGWPASQIAESAVLFAGLCLVAIGTARRRRYLFVGWFLFAGMLVPVIGLVQVGLQAMADRFSYLPLIGIFVALAWGLAELSMSPARRRLVMAGGVVAAAALMAATSAQVRHWKDSEALFGHAVRVAPDNSAAHYYLGAIADSQGKTDEALWHFSEAIRYNPRNVKARYGMGYILSLQGKFEEAAQEYEAALQFEPDLAKAHFGLAEALRKQGKFDQAMEHYTLALRTQPDIPEAHYQLAGLLSSKQDPAAGIAHLEQAVRLEPDWPLALNNLAWVLATQPEARLRNGPEATRLALRAVRLTRRNSPNTLDTLAAAYAETGRFSDAVETAQAAIQKANESGQTNLAAEIESHLKCYQSQRAYRE